MLKTISAALLAVSVLAAPALAAGQATHQATKTAQTPVIKAEQVKTKPSVLNANAKMGKHSYKHARHHRHHIKYAAKRTHHTRVGFKHSAHVTARRG